MFLRTMRGASKQPSMAAAINWSSPLTTQLVTCAYPVGSNFYEAVTRTYATNSTATFALRSPGSGNSLRGNCVMGISGGTANTNFVSWPVSTGRGAELTTEGTVLCLGGTQGQVDGKIYELCGNFETAVDGGGAGLAIDSYQHQTRGGVMKTNFVGAPGHVTTAAFGNPFDNRTYLLGFAFTGTGVTGNFFFNRKTEAWTGRGAHPTTQTNRRLAIFEPNGTGGGSASGRNSDTFVGLVLMWKRALSVGEYQALYDNPWQVLMGN